MANPPRPTPQDGFAEIVGRAFVNGRDSGPFGPAIPQAGQRFSAPPTPLDRLARRAVDGIEEWLGPPSLPPLKREYLGYGPAGSSAWAQKVADDPELHAGYRKFDPSDAAGGGKGRYLNGVTAPKCNIFVYDALRSSGIEPPLIRGNVPTTEQWSDPSKVAGYRVVRPGEPLMQGDIITNGHHMGYTPKVVDGKVRNLTTSAASPLATSAQPLGGPITNDWAFRSTTGDLEPGYVVRRYVEPQQNAARQTAR
jgi:hypothetical protein